MIPEDLSAGGGLQRARIIIRSLLLTTGWICTRSSGPDHIDFKNETCDMHVSDIVCAATGSLIGPIENVATRLCTAYMRVKGLYRVDTGSK